MATRNTKAVDDENVNNTPADDKDGDQEQTNETETTKATSQQVTVEAVADKRGYVTAHVKVK